jgi:hypothetical protein
MFITLSLSLWTADMALIRGFHSSSDKEVVTSTVKTSKDYIRFVKKIWSCQEISKSPLH